MAYLDDLKTSRPALAAFMAVGLCWGSFAGLVPEIKAAIGASDAGFGLAMLLAAVGAFLAMLTAPLAEARLGRRTLPVLALVMACAFLLPGQVGNLAGFALAMLLASAASGTLDVAMNAEVSRLETASGRGLMNLNHALFSFAYAAAAIAAGLAREAGLSPAAVFAGVAGVIVVLSLTMGGSGGRGEGVPGDGAPEGAPRIAVPLWPVLLGGAVILIAFLTEQATEAWSALHLERNLGAGAAAGALGPALLGLTMGVGRLIGQAVVARFDEITVIRAAALITALGTGLAATAPTLAIAYLGFSVLGFGVSVIVPLGFAIVGRAVPAETRTRAIARAAALGYGGFFIGPPLMGFMAQGFGLDAAFLAVAGLLLILAGPLAMALRRRLAVAGW